MKPIFESIDLASDTSLKIAWYDHKSSCDLMDWHIHPEYELVYIKNGSGTLSVDTETISYHNGALIFLGPNIPHADFGNRDFPDNLEVVIQFNEEFVQQKLMNFPEFRSFRNFLRLSNKVLLFDQDLKMELAEAFESFPSLNSTQKIIRFLQILEALADRDRYKTLLDRVTLIPCSPKEVGRLEAIFNYVNSSFEGEISTCTAAAHVGLTTNSFCRFFKKMTGKPFVQFLNEFRINKAVELLEDKDLTISEVMYRSGYSDASYFTKQFKRNKGSTPSYYQNSLKRLA
ncbi:AraC family transcriptional regulator [Poritiphilus flavus]|uniref:Helix-turn-helix domain-containing protein n=1 Tax=Poritiphilus flavus TaxID=2697053 RepID=A0A6L9EIX5_9FLAO|nr:AraC family transcriptional regulator [Poritiphilus flavus]NAS14129.1 helix-turn-helix domain-containing protein [Poritiphilus flavus]